VRDFVKNRMNCLEVYRRELVRGINVEFRRILNEPGEDPVHDFRVGVKRLTAFFYFLQTVDPRIRAKKILKPYRGLFKAIGRVRDLHIAEDLVSELNSSKNDLNKLKKAEKLHYQSFRSTVNNLNISRITVPTIRSLSISDQSVLAVKKPYLGTLLSKVCSIDKRMTQKAWHRKRIILKRYHHTLDAFQHCTGHELDEEELKRMRILEQLLGDWHDRVITSELIIAHSLTESDSKIQKLKRQEKSLISAARIYLHKYSKWHSIPLS
jgi:CHAD domain-containing protein